VYICAIFPSLHPDVPVADVAGVPGVAGVAVAVAGVVYANV